MLLLDNLWSQRKLGPITKLQYTFVRRELFRIVNLLKGTEKDYSLFCQQFCHCNSSCSGTCLHNLVHGAVNHMGMMKLASILARQILHFWPGKCATMPDKDFAMKRCYFFNGDSRILGKNPIAFLQESNLQPYNSFFAWLTFASFYSTSETFFSFHDPLKLHRVNAKCMTANQG